MRVPLPVKFRRLGEIRPVDRFRDGVEGERILNELVRLGWGSWKSVTPGPGGRRPTQKFCLDVYETQENREKSEGFVDANSDAAPKISQKPERCTTANSQIVYTVGFQESEKPNRSFSFPDFVALLKRGGISCLVDIRQHNNANAFETNPWCKNNLAPSLKAQQITYAEMKNLAPSAVTPSPKIDPC